MSEPCMCDTDFTCMADHSKPHVVTPEEAQERLRAVSPEVPDDNPHATLLRTIATEPDRIRAEVVQALVWAGVATGSRSVLSMADQIENREGGW